MVMMAILITISNQIIYPNQLGSPDNPKWQCSKNSTHFLVDERHLNRAAKREVQTRQADQ